MRCASYCTADSYNIRELFDYFQLQAKLVEMHDKVLEVKEDGRHAFFFSYGCVTFWNYDEAAEHHILQLLAPFQRGESQMVHQDKVEFIEGSDTDFDEENDVVTLGSNNPLLKLSLSHAFTQSVKLVHFELLADQAVEHLGDHPKQLAKFGKISLSRKKLSQKIGQLFAVRHNINLHSDILDTPEYFWRRPKYGVYYEQAVDFMDLNERIDILNQRLDVLREFYEILSNELNHHHSFRVEIIITLLIAVEVVMALLYKF